MGGDVKRGESQRKASEPSKCNQPFRTTDHDAFCCDMRTLIYTPLFGFVAAEPMVLCAVVSLVVSRPRGARRLSNT